ncbi:hypothetical protein M5K25_023407 [Dendrobium thyrsiflorum]|uniref:Uncharacterized protein n=1 Tax=Dendrobium thyrsiflorum TaxID=117978 RepID=A0ABD0U846_DENTH
MKSKSDLLLNELGNRKGSIIATPTEPATRFASPTSHPKKYLHRFPSYRFGSLVVGGKKGIGRRRRSNEVAEEIFGLMLNAMENGAGIGGSGFVRRIACFDAAEMEERKWTDPSPSPPVETTVASSTSTSSSIGKDSDEVGSQEDEGEGVVQSAYKGPLLGTESLEESLPVSKPNQLPLRQLLKFDKGILDGPVLS